MEIEASRYHEEAVTDLKRSELESLALVRLCQEIQEIVDARAVLNRQ